MEYYGIMPKRKLWVKVAAICLGCLAVWNAYTNRNWFYVPFGFVIILATFSARKQVVSKEGVDIQYTILGRTFHNMWQWNEVQAVHKDSRKSFPNIEIHINKGVINRRFILSKKDAYNVIDIINEIKPEIDVLEVNHN